EPAELVARGHDEVLAEAQLGAGRRREARARDLDRRGPRGVDRAGLEAQPTAQAEGLAVVALDADADSVDVGEAAVARLPLGHVAAGEPAAEQPDVELILPAQILPAHAADEIVAARQRVADAG